MFKDASGTTVPIDAMVAAALRLAAKSMCDTRDREELAAIAQRIDTGLHEEECPLCKNARCDYMCPLTQYRDAAQKRAGITS